MSTYRKKSYFSSKVQIKVISKLSVRADSQVRLVHIKIIIDEGKPAKIKKIEVEGLKTMSPDFVKSILGFSEGDLYL